MTNEVVSALLLVLGIGIGFNLRYLAPVRLRARKSGSEVDPDK
jgi:hypothetical protein